MIVLRKLAAMQPVLNLMILNKGARDRTDHELEGRCENASFAIFGIRRSSTEMETPSWVPDLPWSEWSEEETDRYNTAWDNWEQPHTDFLCLTREEQLALMREKGWDILDEAGRPLECIGAFIRQIIHVTEGRGGKSVTQIEAESWAASIETPSGPTPERIARNKQFLDLGARRPRSANDAGCPRPTRRAG